MLKRLIFLALILVFGTARAEDPKWVACLDAVGSTAEAVEINDTRGTLTYEEFLITKCGPRPIVSRGNKLLLADEDCEFLFRVINEGFCALPEFAIVDAIRVVSLDPRVFDHKKFAERCRRVRESPSDDIYSDFRAQICEAPAAASKQK